MRTIIALKSHSCIEILEQFNKVDIYLASVEDLNVITDPKCNKVLNVITFGLKCNNVILTPSMTSLTRQ